MNRVVGKALSLKLATVPGINKDLDSYLLPEQHCGLSHLRQAGFSSLRVLPEKLVPNHVKRLR